MLLIYFYLSLSLFPNYFITHNKSSKPSPFLSLVNISSSQIHLKDSFRLFVVAENKGSSADLQVVSISFPNLTSIKNNLQVLTSNFSQKPLIANRGDETGSDYQGQGKIHAIFPAIDLYSRPWKQQMLYGATLKIEPTTLGTFIFFIKLVAFPHIDNSSHYPRSGMKDYQNEFVIPYRIQVVG
jgi:hypothetical protein